MHVWMTAKRLALLLAEHILHSPHVHVRQILMVLYTSKEGLPAHTLLFTCYHSFHEDLTVKCAFQFCRLLLDIGPTCTVSSQGRISQPITPPLSCGFGILSLKFCHKGGMELRLPGPTTKTIHKMVPRAPRVICKTMSLHDPSSEAG
jgi:hypothetical protein